MTSDEHGFVTRLSELARCNPFLPQRIACERAILGNAFQSGGAVWSKRLDRENPNLVAIATKAQRVLDRLRQGLEGAEPSASELELYEELVFYLLYYRFEEAFERTMTTPDASFFEVFARAALDYLPHRSERDLPHWFAFLFQVRRASHHIFDFIVGGSLPAARLRAAVWQSIFTHDLRRYRRTLFDKMADVQTLVTGPSGTGKELVAHAIGLSRYIPFDPREQRFASEPGGTFFPLSLSALAPTLIESELFGHRKGAFTGALSDRKGWLAVCPALGTVFLDEIGDLDPAIQVKLLRVLQTREFQPLGDTRPRRFEGKIVAATHRDLASEMRSGRFREDLYYRLCSDLITTPSLAEQLQDRPEDLPELVGFISRRLVGPEEAGGVAAEVLEWMDDHLSPDYPWPGNVRELEQCVRNIVIRKEYRPPGAGSPEAETRLDLETAALSAEELIEQYCAVVYRKTGSYVETARRLKLDRRTVKSKLEAHEARVRSQ